MTQPVATTPDLPAPIIAPEGRMIVALFVAVGVVITALSAWLFGRVGGGIAGALCGILCAWCVWFFRDPPRGIPAASDAAVSPADGVICAIDRAPPPPELGLAPEATRGMERVSIFMNVFDVHVNRAPVAGRVRAVAYRAGAFINASLDKASERNERSSLVMDMADGRAVVVVQIAGLVARRIVSRVGAGAVLAKGQRFGIIRFGSRVDVHLPPGTRVEVALGQRVRAGSTVIAMLAPPGAGAQAGQREAAACS